MYAQGSYQSNSYNAGASSSSSSGPRTRQGSPYQQPPTPPSAPDVRGRHRKRAELQRLNHEIQILQEELSELDKVPPASKACKELVEFVNNCPDPFLSNSQGVEAARQRWFDPPTESHGCCWR